MRHNKLRHRRVDVQTIPVPTVVVGKIHGPADDQVQAGGNQSGRGAGETRFLTCSPVAIRSKAGCARN